MNIHIDYMIVLYYVQMNIEHDHKVDVYSNDQNNVEIDIEYWGTISISRRSSLRRTRMLSMFATRVLRTIVVAL